MAKIFTSILFALLATTALAHMQMVYPPALRGKTNPFISVTNVDSDMVSPLKGDGTNFPCKGYLSDLHTPIGRSVATWAAGSQQHFSLQGGAIHGGGSCQALLSVDGGNKFKVIHSYIGGCPSDTQPDWPFTVPADTPAGPAVFAWTWFNRIGRREFYMNCASITIEAGSGGTESIAFNSRPDIFEANLDENGCTTVEMKDVQFPDPGPDVTYNNSTVTSPVSGTCSPVKFVSLPISSSGSDSGSGSSFATATTPGSPSATNSASSSNTSPVTGSGSGSSALTPTKDGSCGGTQTCAGSTFGHCCSSYGFCGITPQHCGTGCNPAFGTCDGQSTTSQGVQNYTNSVSPSSSSFLATSTTSALAGNVVMTSTNVKCSTAVVRVTVTETAASPSTTSKTPTTFQTMTKGASDAIPAAPASGTSSSSTSSSTSSTLTRSTSSTATSTYEVLSRFDPIPTYLTIIPVSITSK